MKAIFEFDMEDPDQAERFRRVSLADEMAGLLYDICFPERPLSRMNGVIDPEASQAVLDACYAAGIDFEKIYS